jgi:hypothetical protein
MRSPVERQLAYFVEAARIRRVTAGIPVDERLVERLRSRWPQRLACSLACGPGWSDLIEGVNDVLDMWGVGDITFSDIKEKYGSIRLSFYGDDPDGRVDELTEAAEEISISLCETCGKRAALRSSGGWLSTACDEHASAGAQIVRVKSEIW